jgi:hypothetical protein
MPGVRPQVPHPAVTQLSRPDAGSRRARLGQRVLEPLSLAPVVFLAALLAWGLHDGGDRRGALGSQVTVDDAGAAIPQLRAGPRGRGGVAGAP